MTTTTRRAEELAAPLGSVAMGRLVFVRGAAHLTIGVDAAMADCIGRGSRARCPRSGSMAAR